MPTIKITDDNGKSTTSFLTGYSLDPLEQDLILEINFPNGSVKYLIHTDRREPNMYNIEKFISDYFDNALNNSLTAHVEEFLRRDYIYIGDNELRRQFTAQKK